LAVVEEMLAECQGKRYGNITVNELLLFLSSFTHTHAIPDVYDLLSSDSFLGNNTAIVMAIHMTSVDESMLSEAKQ